MPPGTMAQPHQGGIVYATYMIARRANALDNALEGPAEVEQLSQFGPEDVDVTIEGLAPVDSKLEEGSRVKVQFPAGKEATFTSLGTQPMTGSTYANYKQFRLAGKIPYKDFAAYVAVNKGSPLPSFMMVWIPLTKQAANTSHDSLSNIHFLLKEAVHKEKEKTRLADAKPVLTRPAAWKQAVMAIRSRLPSWDTFKNRVYAAVWRISDIALLAMSVEGVVGAMGPYSPIYGNVSHAIAIPFLALSVLRRRAAGDAVIPMDLLEDPFLALACYGWEPACRRSNRQYQLQSRIRWPLPIQPLLPKPIMLFWKWILRCGKKRRSFAPLFIKPYRHRTCWI